MLVPQYSFLNKCCHWVGWYFTWKTEFEVRATDRMIETSRFPGWSLTSSTVVFGGGDLEVINISDTWSLCITWSHNEKTANQKGIQTRTKPWPWIPGSRKCGIKASPQTAVFVIIDRVTRETVSRGLRKWLSPYNAYHKQEDLSSVPSTTCKPGHNATHLASKARKAETRICPGVVANWPHLVTDPQGSQWRLVS